MERSTEKSSPAGLGRDFNRLSVWAFSIGTSIGWGSLVVTCNTYLASAGVWGTVLGLAVGMLVILIITRNLQYMIRRSPNAGGIYTFAKQVCGPDYGFLAAWFLLLTYMAILWANVTSVPLFARYFFGDIFRFGFSYNIFGYEVWLGEALLSIAAVLLTGVFCANSRKAIHIVMIVSALVFVAGFSFLSVYALINHGASGFSYDPAFIPDSSSFSQIARIAVISPWAFIGFENISHFSEEFSFPVKKSRRILLVSVVLSTLLYVFVTLLSVTAYPPEYASWLDYIRDMGNLSGIKAVPAFYAAHHYLGDAGVAILMFSLFGAILTSLIGNTTALSRLLFAAGREGDAPRFLGKLSRKGLPSRAVWIIIAVSSLIPLLGRTAIGWIVDVTTLGATIIYGLVSYAVWRDARRQCARPEKVTGVAGLVLMVGFVTMILLPKLFFGSLMESESYILFVLWALIGLAVFRVLVARDQSRRYGHSVIVWLILLMLVLFSSMMWVSRMTQNVTDSAMADIHSFYESGLPFGGLPAGDEAFLADQAHRITVTNTWFTVASFALFLIFSVIILNNYFVMKKRDREHSEKLILAESRAMTDQLTGVKNRNAFSAKELSIDDRIRNGDPLAFAIVVCDVNDLKLVNDRKGHNAGDDCIRAACRVICQTYKHSPVYRIGGDEFAVVLEGGDYERRAELIRSIIPLSEERSAEIGSSFAAGMAEFLPGEDLSFAPVFARADRDMYSRKSEMKRWR